MSTWLLNLSDEELERAIFGKFDLAVPKHRPYLDFQSARGLMQNCGLTRVEASPYAQTFDETGLTIPPAAARAQRGDHKTFENEYCARRDFSTSC
jgi:hypothetical protein